MNQQVKEQHNASGQFTRPLFIKHLELEYWIQLERLQVVFGTKTLAATIRQAIKKASGN